MTKKIRWIFFYIGLSALFFSNNTLGQDESPDCTRAKENQSESDITACLQGDLDQKSKALIKKFKEIPIPMGAINAPAQGLAPAQNSAQPRTITPLQAITPTQPVVQPLQPTIAPKQKEEPTNIYNY